MKTRLRRISPFSVACLLGTIAFILSCLSVVAILTTHLGENAQLSTFGFGVITSSTRIHPVQLVLGPIFIGGSSFVSGAVIALFYNLWARITGGIQIEIEDEVAATHAEPRGLNPQESLTGPAGRPTRQPLGLQHEGVDPAIEMPLQ